MIICNGKLLFIENSQLFSISMGSQNDKLEKVDHFQAEILNNEMGYFFRFNEILYSDSTPYQKVQVLESSRFGKVLRLDNIFQTSEWDEFLYHEPLVHVPSISHGDIKNVLVIGGGDGGAIREFLKYPSLESITMIELDERVVQLCKKYIPSISNGSFDSPKLKLFFQDGVKFIRESNEKFDVIMLDLTDPFGPSVELYTKEFYHELSMHLTENGFISLHIESPISRPEIFARLYHTLKSVFSIVRPMTNYVPMYGTLWGYAVASNKTDPMEIPKNIIEERINHLQTKDLRFYNPETHFSLMTLPNYIQDLLKKPHLPISTGETLIEEDISGNWKICYQEK